MYSSDQQWWSQAVHIPHMDIKALKKVSKTKKLVKKPAKKYGVFLASESLIKQIPWILGPGLKKSGNFPSILTHNENKMANQSWSEIHNQVPDENVALAVAVGRLKIADNELVYNIHSAANFLVSLLKKSWQNTQALYIKSTMRKPQHLYQGTA